MMLLAYDPKYMFPTYFLFLGVCEHITCDSTICQECIGGICMPKISEIGNSCDGETNYVCMDDGTCSPTSMFSFFLLCNYLSIRQCYKLHTWNRSTKYTTSGRKVVSVCTQLK